MTTEMYIRLGYYSGLASRHLGDTSYEERFRFNAEVLTDKLYWRTVSEIQQRLVAGKFIAADEDPFEREIRSI